MKLAYQNMRAFWMDAKNMQSKKGLIEIGPDKVVAAAVEMAFADGAELKYVLIATNSLGDSSLYFENNSRSGLGGMIGGHGNEKLQQAAAHMLAYAAKLTPQMTKLPAGTEVPSPAQAGQVCLLAVSQTAVFYKQVPEEALRQTEHPFYPMFAYSQQVIGLFKESSASDPSARA